MTLTARKVLFFCLENREVQLSCLSDDEEKRNTDSLLTLHHHRVGVLHVLAHVPLRLRWKLSCNVDGKKDSALQSVMLS